MEQRHDPEFSRLIPVDRVPEAGLEEEIEADDKERAPGAALRPAGNPQICR